jgi:predicted sugar kinase
MFADARMRQLAEVLEARELRGFGQSSWGPTLFILCPDAEFAGQLVSDLANEPAGAGCEFTIAGPKNQGADVQSMDVL